MDIGHILSTTPPIVENIFMYLNGCELDSCSKVCRLWCSIAQTEKKRRENIAWFFQSLHCNQHNTIHSSCRECSVDYIKDIEVDFSDQMKSLNAKPKFCLTFASSYFISDFHRLFTSFEYSSPSQPKKMKPEDVIWQRAYLKAVIQKALGSHLPRNCSTTFCVAPGIIGCRSDVSLLEIEEGHGITGIMIPHIPGLDIYNFSIDDRTSDISKVIPKDVNIKCLLLFLKPNDLPSSFHKVIQSCLLRESLQVAVGGAMIERLDSKHSSVVAFCGRSVEAASVIINPKDKEGEVEEKLRLFAETGLLENKCFAFMFACVARGYFIYREYNLESSIFHRLYPEVPLMGVFGNGEIGVNFLPNVPSTERPEVLRIGRLTKCRKKFLHSYTTIFVLVSVKL